MCAVQQAGNTIITDLTRKFRDIGKKISLADFLGPVFHQDNKKAGGAPAFSLTEGDR